MKASEIIRITEGIRPPVTFAQVVTPEWITEVLEDGFDVGTPHPGAMADTEGGHDIDAVSRLIEDLADEDFFPEDIDLDDVDQIRPYITKWMKSRYSYVTRNMQANKVKGGFLIYRAIKVQEEHVSAIASGDQPLGMFWAFCEESAEAHWGNFDHTELLFEAVVASEKIDWITTIRRNMNYVLGDDEQEVSLKSGTPLRLIRATVDGKPLPINPHRVS